MGLLKIIFSSSKKAKNWRLFIFIIALVAGSLLTNLDTKYNAFADKIAVSAGLNLPRVAEHEFKLGLDLLGGSHLVYEAKTDNIPEEDKKNAVEGVRDVIERRVNFFGVSEPVVQTSISNNQHRIIVELAGIKDVGNAIGLIGETPLLEFKEQGEDSRELNEEEIKMIEEYNTAAKTTTATVLEKINNGDEFEELVSRYSEDETTKEVKGEMGWITGLTHPNIINIVASLEESEISNEFSETNAGYELFKLNETRVKTNPFDENKQENQVKASHILICHSSSEECESEITKEEAYSKIKELKKIVTTDNFIEIAREYSDEPGADVTNGNLGWFGRGQMLKPFEDTVFDNQEVGTISYVVETKYGFHLIFKEDEKNVIEYNVSNILVRTMSEESLLGAANTWTNTKLTGKYLKRASVQFGYTDNAPEVLLEFDKEGSELFANISERNIGKQVAIFLDGYPISAPIVNSRITGGQAVISGNFNVKEANLLTQRLNAGALPVPISLINQKTVGASLGEESVKKSLEAGVIGLSLVIIFMILYYRLPGIIAVISLLIYGSLMLAIFKLWPITLTLSGLAGFILSIGMAVDANILIFERLKEELRTGSPLSVAIEDGFRRAWSSIRDGNISTLITCFILIQFTTSIVKGFALTLSLGVIVSMFSAVIITRNLLTLTSGTKLGDSKWLWLKR